MKPVQPIEHNRGILAAAGACRGSCLVSPSHDPKLLMIAGSR